MSFESTLSGAAVRKYLLYHLSPMPAARWFHLPSPKTVSIVQRAGPPEANGRAGFGSEHRTQPDLGQDRAVLKLAIVARL